MLAIAVTVIEVALIVSLMVSGDQDASTLPPDTGRPGPADDSEHAEPPTPGET